MKKKIGEYKIKNRYLIYIVLCSFFLGSFLGIVIHPVAAISFTYDFGFEDGTLNSDYSSGSASTFRIVTKEQYTEFEVDNVKVKTGTKSFLGRGAGTGGRGWWNLTYNSSLFLTTFEMYYCKTTSPSINYIGFYNRSSLSQGASYTDPDNMIILLFDFGSTPNKVQYQDHNGVSTTIYSGVLETGGSTWNYFKFDVLSNDTVVYYHNSSFVTGSPRNVTAFSQGKKIDGIRFNIGDAVGTESMNIDDISFTIADSYPLSSSACPLSGDHYGTNAIGCFIDVLTPYLEKEFMVPFSGNITGVDLSVNPSQYSGDPDPTHYFLWVNGDSQSFADCFFEDEYGFVLRWLTDVEVSDSAVVLEFYHTQALSSGKYWLVGAGCTLGDDLDGDLDASYRYHSSSGGINGIYSGTRRNYDLGTIIYYNDFLFSDTSSPYDDLVTCPKTVYDTFDTIPLFYFISDFTYTNTIQLWRNGSQLTSQGFPLTIKTGDFNGESSYTTFHSGKYQFRLVRNSVIKSTFNVTVTNPADMSFILSVYPNPCDFNTLVSIGYRFFPVDGADGFIGVSEFSDTSNYSSFDPKWSLTANTSGNYSFYPQTNMYVSLWKKSGPSYILMKIRYLRTLSLFDNTINIGYKSIQLSDAHPSVSQRIYGTQVVQGFNTFVRMNNKLLQYVTDTPFYNVYVDIVKGGNYNAELCMETANGTQVLCSVNFTVSSPAAGGGAGAEAFPAEMKLLFGICCILVAVSCPLMISVKYHVAVPTFVYVVFMAFGIGIGTVLGFLELWLVFLFVVALVAGAVFTIFGHGGQGGGGGDSGTIRKGGILSRRGGKDYAGASRKADYGVSPKGSPGYLKGPGQRGY